MMLPWIIRPGAPEKKKKNTWHLRFKMEISSPGNDIFYLLLIGALRKFYTK
jgi:hypothetical protein